MTEILAKNEPPNWQSVTAASLQAHIVGPHAAPARPRVGRTRSPARSGVYGLPLFSNDYQRPRTDRTVRGSCRFVQFHPVLRAWQA